MEGRTVDTGPTPHEVFVERSTPRYATVKNYVLQSIRQGAWPPHHRIPSENEIVVALGVSRMTANRALRELAAEGAIFRVQGVGSFVAPPSKGSAPLLGVRNIADEIRERGHLHGARIVLMQEETAVPDVAEPLGLDIGTRMFHSIITHYEDDVPIQIEDRFVNPAVAPDYMRQPFEETTPNAYLTSVAPDYQVDQVVEAVTPQPWECRLLSISSIEPCLMIRRRTWSQEVPVTSVRLLYPGSRYRLEGSSR